MAGERDPDRLCEIVVAYFHAAEPKGPVKRFTKRRNVSALSHRSQLLWAFSRTVPLYPTQNSSVTILSANANGDASHA
jgi:hypothetical protein